MLIVEKVEKKRQSTENPKNPIHRTTDNPFVSNEYMGLSYFRHAK